MCAGDYGHGMTIPAMQPEPPLPPPWAVPDAPLDLKFALMTPDQIRRFVRDEAIMGRRTYKDLYSAAVRALGPKSPEAQHPPAHTCHTIISDEDTDVSTYVVYEQDAWRIVSKSYVWDLPSDRLQFVTSFARYADRPELNDVFVAHRAALPVFSKMRQDAAAAKKAREAEAVTETPAVAT